MVSYLTLTIVQCIEVLNHRYPRWQTPATEDMEQVSQTKDHASKMSYSYHWRLGAPGSQRQQAGNATGNNNNNRRCSLEQPRYTQDNNRNDQIGNTENNSCNQQAQQTAHIHTALICPALGPYFPLRDAAEAKQNLQNFSPQGQLLDASSLVLWKPITAVWKTCVVKAGMTVSETAWLLGAASVVSYILSDSPLQGILSYPQAYLIWCCFSSPGPP